MPQNTIQDNNPGVDLPDVSKNNKKKPKTDPEMERLNKLMIQMKMNSCGT